MHYAKWRKPVTKGHILFDSINLKCPERANPETVNRLVIAKDQWEAGIVE
jgi:hypothetical protein